MTNILIALLVERLSVIWIIGAKNVLNGIKVGWKNILDIESH